MDEVNFELSKEGLRVASSSESGWYYTVMVDGEPVSVWVTEIETEVEQ